MYEVASKEARKATASKYTISYQNKDFKKIKYVLGYYLTYSFTDAKLRHICIIWFTYKHKLTET